MTQIICTKHFSQSTSSIIAQNRLFFMCMMTSSQPLITLAKFNITSWPLCSFRYGWSWYSPFSSTRALYSYWQAVIMVSILSVQSHAVCVCWRWGFLETCSSSTRFSFGTHFVPSSYFSAFWHNFVNTWMVQYYFFRGVQINFIHMYSVVKTIGKDMVLPHAHAQIL